jgi:hypothetical protein
MVVVVVELVPATAVVDVTLVVVVVCVFPSMNSIMADVIRSAVDWPCCPNSSRPSLRLETGAGVAAMACWEVELVEISPVFELPIEASG